MNIEQSIVNGQENGKLKYLILKTEEYLNINKAHWNERVSIHKKSEFYQLEKFKLGFNKLHSLEISELGDVNGKSILHLQCHFGMDTLSLERMGANVTGVDFSEEAIKAANEKHQEGLLTAEQLSLVVRMLHIVAVMAGKQKNNNNGGEI